MSNQLTLHNPQELIALGYNDEVKTLTELNNNLLARIDKDTSLEDLISIQKSVNESFNTMIKRQNSLVNAALAACKLKETEVKYGGLTR